MPEVGIPIDGRPTDVEPHVRSLCRDEGFFATVERVIDR